MSNIDFSMMVTAEAAPAIALHSAREAASVGKASFCIALAEIGILTDAECVSSAKGEWPHDFTDFLEYLTPAEARNAQTLWAGSTDILRMDGTILALAWWFDISDADLDRIFMVTV
jgi:hypothetical protein